MPLKEAPGRTPMAYAEEGPSPGSAGAVAGNPPLLCVHGWAAHGGLFAPQFARFADTHRVIAPDLRGHGRSRAGAAPDIAGMADDVAALLEDLDLDGVVAVGWSMGAAVLWDLLRRSPAAERIAGLVVVDMTPRILNDVSWRLGLAGGFDALDSARATMRMREDWREFSVRVAANALASEGAPPALLETLQADFAGNDPELMAQAWESLCSMDLREDIARIATPTLVAYGARSQLYAPDVSAYLVAHAPNAVRVPFQRSGHAPHLEEPERFNRLLNDFVAILSGQDARHDMQRLGETAAAHQA
jgi:pimeloyl-[acyl-carrier protein] methyl ester esterase